MFYISLSNESIKFLESQTEKTNKRIEKALDEISDNPYRGNHIKKLKGKLAGRYRYRLGDIRIVYRIQEEKITVYVVSINNRGDAY